MSKYRITENIEGSFYFDRFHKPKPENIPETLLNIVQLFEEDCDQTLDDCYILYNRLFIKGSNNKGARNELMLRFNFEGSRDLIIARVEFINKRKGYMTRLSDMLNEIMEYHNYNKIIIESVLTDEMKNWCIKNDFIENFFGDIENLKSTGCFSKKKEI